jgi:hypothetical protein
MRNNAIDKIFAVHVLISIDYVLQNLGKFPEQRRDPATGMDVWIVHRTPDEKMLGGEGGGGRRHG